MSVYSGAAAPCGLPVQRGQARRIFGELLLARERRSGSYPT
ncbi:hypothetical protein [Kitasatospora sp. NPDC088783]